MTTAAALGASPVVKAAMRRNRRRMLVLCVVSAANAFVVFALLGTAVATSVVLGLPSIVDRDWTVPWQLLVVIGAVIGIVRLVLEAIRVVRDLPNDVSGGLGVEPFTDDHSRVPALLGELALATGLPLPAEVGFIRSPVPNALAVGVGASKTALVVTTGLVSSLTRDELEGVLASELIASARLDITVRSLLVDFSYRARTLYASFVPLDHWANPLFLVWAVVFAPTQLATRVLWRTALVDNGEGADRLAIAITRNPESLLHALRKLRADDRRLEDVAPVSVPLWVEPDGVAARGRLPFTERSVRDLLDRRIARLEALVGER